MEQAFSPAKIFRLSEAIYRKKFVTVSIIGLIHLSSYKYIYIHYDVSKDAVFCYVHSAGLCSRRR